MKQLALHLVLFFSLISLVKAQNENALAFHQISGNQTILLHPGDFVKIQASDSSGQKRVYRGTFESLEAGAIHLKYHKAGIPVHQIDRMKIRPQEKKWVVWSSLGLGLLLVFIGFIVSLNGLFPPKGQLENSGLKTGPRIMLAGIGVLAVLFPILINTTLQPIRNLQKDWTYETLSYAPAKQPPAP